MNLIYLPKCILGMILGLCAHDIKEIESLTLINKKIQKLINSDVIFYKLKCIFSETKKLFIQNLMKEKNIKEFEYTTETEIFPFDKYFYDKNMKIKINVLNGFKHLYLDNEAACDETIKIFNEYKQKLNIAMHNMTGNFFEYDTKFLEFLSTIASDISLTSLKVNDVEKISQLKLPVTEFVNSFSGVFYSKMITVLTSFPLKKIKLFCNYLNSSCDDFFDLVRKIGKINTLKEVALISGLAHDTHIEHLKDLYLEELYLSNTNIVGSAFKSLSEGNTKNLHTLIIRGVKKLHNENIDYLAKLNNLRTLDLTFGSITNDGLGKIGNIIGLVNLSVAFCPISSGKDFGKLQNLRELNISNTNITSLNFLKNLHIKKLFARNLSLSHFDITLKHKIDILDISDCKLTSEFMKQLCGSGLIINNFYYNYIDSSYGELKMIGGIICESLFFTNPKNNYFLKKIEKIFKKIYPHINVQSAKLFLS